MPTYEIYTAPNGKQYQFPEGTTPDQAENLIAKIDPTTALRYGVVYQAEKEFDFDTGVPDIGLRTKLAMTRGNPAEIANVLNEAVGKGNWGIDNGEIYLTPKGQVNAGQEADPQGRKRMVDSGGFELADVTADIAPEIAQGVAAIAATALTATPGGQVAGLGILGSLLTRGLVASSIRAGVGDAAAYIGLEGIQELQGYNEDSLKDVLGSAGLQGSLAAGANFLLGAPLAGLGKTAKILKDNADELGKVPALTSGTYLKEVLDAEAALAPRIGADNANLVSLYTLAKAENAGLVARNMIPRVEGLAIRSDTKSYVSRQSDVLNKIVTLADREIATGLSVEQAVVKAAKELSDAEKKLITKAYAEVKNLNKSPFIQDAANTDNIVKWADYSNDILKRTATKIRERLAGPEYYGSPILKELRLVGVSDDAVADVINSVASKYNMPVENVYRLLQNNYGKMVDGRIELKNGVAVVSKEEPAFKLPPELAGTKLAQEAAEYVGKEIKGPPPLNAYDLLEAEKAIRNSAWKSGNRPLVRESLLTSDALVKELDKIVPEGAAAKEQLNISKAAYKKDYADPFFGTRDRKGIFDLLTSPVKSTDIEEYVKSIVQGKIGGPLIDVVRNLNKLFPETDAGKAAAAASGMPTAKELTGKIGYMFVRDLHNKMTQELAQVTTAQEAAKVGKKYLKKIVSMRDTVKRRVRGEPEGQKIMDDVLNTPNVQEFVKSVRDIASGVPARYNSGIGQLKNIIGTTDANAMLKQIDAAASRFDIGSIARLAAAKQQAQNVSPQLSQLYSDMFTSEVHSKLISAMSIADDAQRLLAVKNWATDLSAALRNPQNDAALRTLMGNYYQPMKEYAYVIQGMLEVDKTSGIIAAQMQTASLVTKILQGAFSGAVKPLVYMYTMKQFVPGQPAWNALSKAIRTGQSPEDILKNFAPRTKMIMASAQRTAELYESGRAGLVAAGIASAMDNAELSTPSVTELPTVPVQTRFNEEKYAAQKQAAQQPQQPDIAMQQQQLGAAMQNLLQAAQQAGPVAGVAALKPPSVAQSLKEGQKLARQYMAAASRPLASSRGR